MKSIVSAIVSVILSAGLTYYVMDLQMAKHKKASDLEKLNMAEKSVRKRLDELSERITLQLKAFSEVVSNYKDFSLKILVENDPYSPIVTEIASRFLKPMGFSLLEITDSSWKILSSGHFPASVGNSSAEKARFLSGKASLCVDNILGEPTLTLQAKTDFSIAGFTFHTTGGVIVDKELLEILKPGQEVTLLLKKGNEYIGMDGIGAVSPVKDHNIIINDKRYLAAEIEIPSEGIEDNVSVIVVLNRSVNKR